MSARLCLLGLERRRAPEYRRAAEHLGQVLAERRIGLVYGGARVGLMGAVADAALAGGGEVIGVIPSGLVAKEIAHPGLTDLRVVASMHERKALMADLADAFVALPGGGARSRSSSRCSPGRSSDCTGSRAVCLNVCGYFDGLLAFAAHSVAEGFVRPEHGGMMTVADAPGPLLDSLAVHRPPVVEKWLDRATT